MKILGIDPGTTRIGYGVISAHGSDLQYLSSGLLKIISFDKEKRLLELATEYESLLKKEKPDLVSLEKLYFVKNVKTGLEVAQSRGVIIFLTKQNKIPIVEYTPSEMKLNITGSGNADKKAVAKMVRLILKTDEIKGPDDVFDAVAIAIVAANHAKFNKS
ncbi:MAG: crossover junction endodeoxyribonuclease RuvC [Patescibacteria group bacterium]